MSRNLIADLVNSPHFLHQKRRLGESPPVDEIEVPMPIIGPQPRPHNWVSNQMDIEQPLLSPIAFSSPQTPDTPRAQLTQPVLNNTLLNRAHDLFPPSTSIG